MDEVYPDYPDVVVGVVVVNCTNPMKLATFWSEVLQREIVAANDDWVNLVWSPRFAVGMSFQRVPETKVGTNRLHLDVFCTDVEATARKVEELGGRRAEGFGGTALVMRDVEDNEFCLIPSPGG